MEGMDCGVCKHKQHFDKKISFAKVEDGGDVRWWPDDNGGGGWRSLKIRGCWG